MRRLPFERWSEWLLSAFLMFAVLWRGGEGADVVWLLTGVACFVTLADVLGAARFSRRRIPTPLLIAGGLFLLWTVVSYLLSTTRNYGFDEVMRTTSFLLLFLWIAQRGRETPFARNLRTILIATALLACLLGMVVYVFQPVSRFVGTFFDVRYHSDYWPNAWAEFLLLVWPLTLFAARGGEGGGHRFWPREHLLLGTGGVFLGCLILSYSRAAFIAFCLQAGLLGLWMLRQRAWDWRSALRKAVLFLAVALMVFLLGNVLRGQRQEVQSLAAKATFTADEGLSSVTERKQFWMQAAQLALERPLFGWGPYSFRFVQPHLQEDVLATSDHAHNVFLKVAMERGIIASLLLLFLFGWVLLPYILSCVRMPQKHRWYARLLFWRGPDTFSPEQRMMFLGVSGVLAHNLVDFNLQFVGIALPFWLMLGLLLWESPVAEPNNLYTKFVRSGASLLAIVLLSVAFWEGIFLVTSSIGRHADRAGDLVTALRWYDRSQGEWFSRDLSLSRAKILYKLQHFTEAKESIDTSLNSNAQDARAWRLKGEIALALRQDEEALFSYGQAASFGQWNDIGTVRGFLALLLQEQGKGAIDERRGDIDRLLIRYASAVGRNAHFIALSGNVEEFIQLTSFLEHLYPADAPRYQVMAAAVDREAKKVRRSFEEQAQGVLW
ncbi:MAG: O-antigen ligase family protein [Candidatus Peribacteraceae bacterium]|nr:O-antigen ligase family protein [Candidatus Peribacteraceae bacterium]